MKTLLLTLIAYTTLASEALACSCVAGTWPLDPTDAIVYAARRATAGKYGTRLNAKVVPEEIQTVRTYPTLGESMNLAGFKGTSCETFGPNRESHFYCSGKSSADYQVVVHRAGKPDCSVLVHAKATKSKVKVRVVQNLCEE